MKKNLLQLALITGLAASLSSCHMAYQVFTVSPEADTKVDSNLVFTNEDIEIGYNFWSNGGTMDYYVFNKTDRPIYLNWDRSHFIINDCSRDYYGKLSNIEYNNFKILKKTKRKVTYSGTTQVSTQYSTRPKNVVEIPPMSKVLSSDFDFVNDVFNHKKLKLGLKSKRTLNMDSANAAPVRFRNYLTYSYTNNFTNAKVIDNHFAVSAITSLTASKFLGQRVKAKNIKTTLNNKSFMYETPYFNKSAFFVRNPLFIKAETK